MKLIFVFALLIAAVAAYPQIKLPIDVSNLSDLTDPVVEPALDNAKAIIDRLLKDARDNILPRGGLAGAAAGDGVGIVGSAVDGTIGAVKNLPGIVQSPGK